MLTRHDFPDGFLFGAVRARLIQVGLAAAALVAGAPNPTRADVQQVLNGFQIVHCGDAGTFIFSWLADPPRVLPGGFPVERAAGMLNWSDGLNFYHLANTLDGVRVHLGQSVPFACTDLRPVVKDLLVEVALQAPELMAEGLTGEAVDAKSKARVQQVRDQAERQIASVRSSANLRIKAAEDQAAAAIKAAEDRANAKIALSAEIVASSAIDTSNPIVRLLMVRLCELDPKDPRCPR